VEAPAPVSTPSPGPPVEAPSPPPAEPGPAPSKYAPLSAKGEDFGEQPADVLLTYAEAVNPSEASQCVGLNASGGHEEFGGIEQGPTADTIRLELVPGGAMPAKVRCPAETEVSPASRVRASDTVTGSDVILVAPAAASPGGVVNDPIDSRYLTEVPFGTSSFWIQPWRAYLDTWPASRLLDSLGINFNVTAKEAPDVARLLQESGFRLARIEIPWGSLSYEHPTQFAYESRIPQRLTALHEHGLRPLILLNANSSGPAPNEPVTIDTIGEAPAGSTTVRLSPASASKVVPGKTGFNDIGFGGMADVLIKSINSRDVATLSMPLAQALPAGEHEGATLLYAPFGPPKLSNGAPNPAFQATLAGWLSYVATVNHEAESIFGPGGYDFEIWNELSFGSQFLNEENYYSPARETGSGSVTEALLDETVAYIRNPAHGISPQVGVSDGFASQTPFASGANVPPGTTALSKHLYKNPTSIPAEYTPEPKIRPLNALSALDSTTKVTEANPIFTPLFTPSYVSALPEYYLTATQTETVIRDLAPITTTIYGVPHGRNVSPPGSEAPQTWMTEYNLRTELLAPINPEHPGEYLGSHVSPTQAGRLQAEILLRSLVSMVSKGMTREYFFAASHKESDNLISESFMSAVDADPSVYPGDQPGGETMEAFRHMLAQFQGPGPTGAARQLQLLSIAQEGNHTEFAGDGTAAHPDLYDREALAVFPFQSSPTRFVIPVYVMTPNLTTICDSGTPEGSPARFDLPNENFRITLGDLPETADPPAVSAYDPITGEATPARLISRQGDRAVFEIAATDYPRLLTIEYG